MEYKNSCNFTIKKANSSIYKFGKKSGFFFPNFSIAKYLSLVMLLSLYFAEETREEEKCPQNGERKQNARTLSPIHFL